MCGRTSQAMSLDQLLKRFHIDSNESLEWLVKYNVAPSLNVPIVIQAPEEKPRIRLMKWGLVPPWAKEKKPQILVNLRAETLLGRPAFKKYLATSRCIMPVDGFFEWQTEKLPKGKLRKIPYRYQPRGEGGIFGLGAVYEGETFCLITTEPNELVSQVCDRMPVIIPEESEAAWLNPETKQADYVTCLAPYPAREMIAYEVSSVVNSGKIDTPECIAPATVHRTCKS